LYDNAYLAERLKHVIVGRNLESEAIKTQFDYVLQGHSSWTVIAGDIGIGKTALVKDALHDLIGLGATSIYGKFEQFKTEEPYIPIIQIINEISSHMLTLPEDKLEHIKIELKKQLGRDAALITEIVPQVIKIVGNYIKIKVDDYLKLRIRLEAAFQKFIEVAAIALYPLIIFVDDLQWVDNPSWNIIKSINNPLNEHDIYIIVTYRNNLLSYREKVNSLLQEIKDIRNVKEIELDSISREDIELMLNSVLEGPIESAYKLTSLIHRKTMGNPLYIKQMVSLLIDNQGICFNTQEGMWQLETDRMKVFNLPSNVDDIINRKVLTLDQRSKTLLNVAACIGSRFDKERLSKVINDSSEQSSEMLTRRLDELCQVGLIIKADEQTGALDADRYEFFHDRIYKNIFEKISTKERETHFFSIAMVLLLDEDKIKVEENILSIAAYLLKCKSLIEKEPARDFISINLFFAGIKAKQTAAEEYALKLFELCEALLLPSSWEEDYQNTLKIKLELAQCEFICGDYETSKKHFEELLEHANNNDDLVSIKKHYASLYAYVGEHENVIELGLQTLVHLGFRINRKHLKVAILKEIIHSLFLFRDSRLEIIKNAPTIKDSRVVDALDVLLIMIAATNLVDEDLFALAVLKSSNLSAQYGNCLYSPASYSAYSLVLGNVLGDYKKSEKVKDISLELAEFFYDNTLICATYFCIGTFVSHWFSDTNQSIDYLKKAFESAMLAGDYAYCAYSITSMIEMQYSMGIRLEDLKCFLEMHSKYDKKMNNAILLGLIDIFEAHIDRLVVESYAIEDYKEKDAAIEALETNENMIYYLLKTHRLYFDGDIEVAFKVAENCIKKLNSIMGYIIQVDFVFYYLLLSLEMKKKGHSSSLFQNRQFQKYKRTLRKWAKTSPENHQAKYLLIEALCISNGNRRHEAAQLYDEAIKHAIEHNHLLLEALGNYLAAYYYESNERVSNIYAIDAYQLFSKWGAKRMANRIRERYQINILDKDTEDIITESQKEMGLAIRIEKQHYYEAKLNQHRKELESMEIEKSFLHFLNIICSEVEAQKGVILLETEGELKVTHQVVDNKVTNYNQGVDFEEVDYIPKKVIRYANRTYEEVILEAKPIDGPYSSDVYIKDKVEISIVCQPLKFNNIFAGLIYIEVQHKHSFDNLFIEFVKRLSFYLFTKHVIKKETRIPSILINSNSVNDQLTNREADVLELMAKGLSNSEISKLLHVSTSTIKTHTLNLYSKLEVNNRIQAVLKAQALELI